MTSRRTVLKVAAASAVSQMMGSFRLAGAGDIGRPSDLYAVLVDERSAAARSVGTLLSSRGAKVLSMDGDDVTSLWLDTIRPVWQQRPAALAGLTTPNAMFCLEHLAWSHGLRVVFHAEHIVLPNASVVHQLQRGGQEAGLTATELMYAGQRWPERVAEAMANHRQQSTRFGPSVVALGPTLPQGAQLLTSWIMAA